MRKREVQIFALICWKENRKAKMLHILLLILKIIGIIIAVILGILLLLIAILLFVPVRYEVQGRCDGSLDSLKGKVCVTWLIHLLRADILYKNGKTKWRFRIAWVKKGNVGAGKKQTQAPQNQSLDKKTEPEAEPEKPEETESDEEAELLAQLEEELKKQKEEQAIQELAKKEAMALETGNEEDAKYEKSIIEETDGTAKTEPEKSEESLAAPQAVRQKSAHAPKSEEREVKMEFPEKEESMDGKKNGKFYKRILAWIQKIKCTFRKICDKIKALSAKKEKIVLFLQNEVHKSAYQKCKKELFRLLKHLKPKKAEVKIVYGFDDPYYTGQVLAVFSVLYPFIGGCTSVTPDFEQQVLKGSVHLKGKIYLCHFVQICWNLIWSKNVRQTYRDIRNFKL